MIQHDARPAVLFDIDGTLADSNYLHVHAWSEALVELDHPVDSWRIHRAIGMDSKKLLAALLGDAADRIGESAREGHSRKYAELSDQIRTFAGARDLLAAVAGHDLQVVLATSAPQDELSRLLEVLDADQWTAHVTSAEDVESAKPDPDILDVALRKAGVPASRAVMVGDAIWDGEAAARAEVAFIGLLSGGSSAADLREAGAVAVYDDASSLLAELVSSPIAELWKAAE
jgi:HAD superfamily hydrolase (TIGR01549 family)